MIGFKLRISQTRNILLAVANFSTGNFNPCSKSIGSIYLNIKLNIIQSIFLVIYCSVLLRIVGLTWYGFIAIHMKPSLSHNILQGSSLNDLDPIFQSLISERIQGRQIEFLENFHSWHVWCIMTMWHVYVPKVKVTYTCDLKCVFREHF